MHFPKELTTVTSLSKIIAAILFVILPILTFFAGMYYQMRIDQPTYYPPQVIYKKIANNNPSPTNFINPTESIQPTETPTDETASWKTYTNEKYGFMYKYPPEMEFKVGTLDQYAPVDTFLDSVEPYIEIKIAVSTKSEENRLNDWGSVSLPQKKHTITIDGVQGNRYADWGGVGGGSVYQQRIFFKKNNNLYYVATGSYDENNEIINKILSTFKFIK